MCLLIFLKFLSNSAFSLLEHDLASQVAENNNILSMVIGTKIIDEKSAYIEK